MGDDAYRRGLADGRGGVPRVTAGWRILPHSLHNNPKCSHVCVDDDCSLYRSIQRDYDKGYAAGSSPRGGPAAPGAQPDWAAAHKYARQLRAQARTGRRNPKR